MVLRYNFKKSASISSRTVLKFGVCKYSSLGNMKVMTRNGRVLREHPASKIFSISLNRHLDRANKCLGDVCSGRPTGLCGAVGAL